jgi:hypothetical protein
MLLIAYIRGMNLDLTDEQTEALTLELSQIVQNDRYPLSPRIVALKEILGMLRPEPEREPLPPRRHYEPPSRGTLSRRGWRPIRDEIPHERFAQASDLTRPDPTRSCEYNSTETASHQGGAGIAET